MSTLYTVTIDTEEEWDWPSGFPTTGFTVENIPHLRRFQDFCTRMGVTTTYFTDLAVFENATARAVILELAQRPNVEIGMHIHPWNTPPFDPSKPVSARESFIHNLPPDIQIAKMGSVYQAFESSNLKPTSFRGGRYSCGPTVQDFLREKGFAAEASVLPYSTWQDEMAPDYRQRDLQPVRLPPRRPEEKPLWEVPLTLGFTRQPFAYWQRWYDRVEHSWLSKLRLIGIAERIGIVRRIWLSLEDRQGFQMLSLLKVLRTMNLPCICFTFHSSSLLAGKNVFNKTPAEVEAFYARTEETLKTLAAWPEFQPATVSEVANHLEDSFSRRPTAGAAIVPA